MPATLIHRHAVATRREQLPIHPRRVSALTAAALLLSFGLAAPLCAQMEYMGNIALPDGHFNFIRVSTSPVDATSPDYNPNGSDNVTKFITNKSIHALHTDYATRTATFAPGATGVSELSLTTKSIAVAYNRGLNEANWLSDYPDPEDQFILFSGSRNSLTTYDYTNRERLTGAVMNDVSSSARDAMATGRGYAVIASNNQLWTSPMNATAKNYNYGASDDEVPWPVLPTGEGTNIIYFDFDTPAVFTNIATVSPHPEAIQFTHLTEIAFAPGDKGGLLFALDWGAQRISAFDVADPAGDYFRYSFDIPIDLTLTNTTGLGFTINDAGHMFLSDGRGGGIELNLTGDLLATFTPPEDDLAGINVNLGNGTNLGDDGTPNGPNSGVGDTLAHYITYSQTGDVFVMDGTYGLHWYRDTAAVPEPSTYAVAIVALLGIIVLRRRRAVP